MKRPQRTTLVKYTATGCVCLMLGGTYLVSQTSELGNFFGLDTVTQMRLLCDAFTVPGMLLILFGLLMAVSREGVLDGVTYLGHYVIHALIPGQRDGLLRYGDYVAAKREKRESNPGNYRFLYIAGGVCMAVAMVFFGLYYHYYAA